jgi:ipoprotein LpqH
MKPPAAAHVVLLAVAAVAVAACSSPPPPAPAPSGVLVTGTAQVTIDDQALRTTKDVACQTNLSLTNITIGKAPEQVTIWIDNSNGPTADSVAIDNFGGFTGSYWQNLQGSANTSMIDQTYKITGTASGFHTANPSARATENFTIDAAC